MATAAAVKEPSPPVVTPPPAAASTARLPVASGLVQVPMSQPMAWSVAPAPVFVASHRRSNGGPQGASGSNSVASGASHAASDGRFNAMLRHLRDRGVDAGVWGDNNNNNNTVHTSDATPASSSGGGRAVGRVYNGYASPMGGGGGGVAIAKLSPELVSTPRGLERPVCTGVEDHPWLHHEVMRILAQRRERLPGYVWCAVCVHSCVWPCVAVSCSCVVLVVVLSRYSLPPVEQFLQPASPPHTPPPPLVHTAHAPSNAAQAPPQAMSPPTGHGTDNTSAAAISRAVLNDTSVIVGNMKARHALVRRCTCVWPCVATRGHGAVLMQVRGYPLVQAQLWQGRSPMMAAAHHPTTCTIVEYTEVASTTPWGPGSNGRGDTPSTLETAHFLVPKLGGVDATLPGNTGNNVAARGVRAVVQLRRLRRCVATADDEADGGSGEGAAGAATGAQTDPDPASDALARHHDKRCGCSGAFHVSWRLRGGHRDASHALNSEYGWVSPGLPLQHLASVRVEQDGQVRLVFRARSGIAHSVDLAVGLAFASRAVADAWVKAVAACAACE